MKITYFSRGSNFVTLAPFLEHLRPLHVAEKLFFELWTFLRMGGAGLLWTSNRSEIRNKNIKSKNLIISSFFDIYNCTHRNASFKLPGFGHERAIVLAWRICFKRGTKQRLLQVAQGGTFVTYILDRAQICLQTPKLEKPIAYQRI